MKASKVRHGVVAFAVTLAILAYMQRVAISQAAGNIQADLGLDKDQMGLVFGAFGLSYALFEMPSGILGDRFGTRSTLVRIVVAWSAFTALTGAAWNVVSLWIIRFLFGAGEAGCFPNLTRMLSVWLPARERVRAQSWMWACTRWGGAVTPPVLLVAISAFGWRWAFVVLALLGVAWALIFHRWYRDDPAQHAGVNAQELELLGASRALTASEGAAHWGQVLARGEVWLLLVQYFCFSFVWYFYVTWLPTYLREARGLTPEHAAALTVLPLLFGGFGSIAGGFLANRYPLRIIARLGFFFTAVLLYAVTRIESAPAAMVVMGLASFCSDLTMPISWNACVELGRRHTATVSAAMNMFGNFAGFVAPVIGGVILKRVQHGGWNVLLYLMVVSALISAACWLFLNPRGPAAAPAPPVPEPS